MLHSALTAFQKISGAWRNPGAVRLREGQVLTRSVEARILDAIAQTRTHLKELPVLPLRIYKILKWGRDRDKALSLLTALDAGLPYDPFRDLPLTRDTLRMAKAELGAQSLNALKNGSPALMSQVMTVQKQGGIFSQRLQNYQNALSMTAEDFAALLDAKGAPHKAHKNSVLYVLNAPADTGHNGYAIRSRAVMDGLSRQGLTVSAVSLPAKPAEAGFTGDIIDDVVHFAELIIAQARAQNSAVILAASNWFIGLSALVAAKALGLPCVYEVRGFWAITRLAVQPDYERSFGYAVQQYFEGYVSNQADQVFTSNSAMKAQLIEQGVPESSIHLAPNGAPKVKPTVAASAKVSGPERPFTLGFVGTVTDYEGVSVLIEALEILVKSGAELRLIIVGDGPALLAAKRQSQQAGLSHICDFKGRLSAKAALDAYSDFDLVVIPRLDHAVTRLVQPLKVIEAMAMGKAVIISDLLALRPEDGPDTPEEPCVVVTPPGDAPALAKAINTLKNNPELLQSLEVRAQGWSAGRGWDDTLASMGERLKALT